MFSFFSNMKKTFRKGAMAQPPSKNTPLIKTTIPGSGDLVVMKGPISLWTLMLIAYTKGQTRFSYFFPMT